MRPPRHIPTPRHARRAMTLLEFLLALMVTALISVAMGGMVTAVARATELDQHTRQTTVRSQAAMVRLASYISPARCVLSSETSRLVIWLDDTRESQTVHATEVRWIDHDPDTGTIELHYVSFPDSLSPVERDLLDVVLPVATTDWWATLQSYDCMSYISTVRLCDGVGDLDIHHLTSTEQAKRLVTFTITFEDAIGGAAVVTAASVQQWEEPTS